MPVVSGRRTFREVDSEIGHKGRVTLSSTGPRRVRTTPLIEDLGDARVYGTFVDSGTGSNVPRAQGARIDSPERR